MCLTRVNLRVNNMLDNIGVLQGISGKMGWLNQRQTIIAQNVANADTPRYVPHDSENS